MYWLVFLMFITRAFRMLAAIKACQLVIKKAAYFLLKMPVIAMKPTKEFFFDMEEIWRHHNELPSRSTIILDALWPVRRLVLYNALAFRRTEILSVIVSSPHVEVSGYWRGQGIAE